LSGSKFLVKIPGDGGLRKAIASIVIGSALLSAPSLTAQSVPPIPARRPPEWGAAAGYGFSVHLNYGRSSEHVLLFEPSAGFRISSHLEYIVEGHFAQYFTPGGYMIGVMPVGGRLYLGHGRTLPYVSIGGGLGWTDLTVEEIDRRFNFLLQASAGVRRTLSETDALTLEARLAHISNGGTKKPNLGLNCLVILAGWRFK
jgi:lipid A 3-O-deacylase PagL